MNIFTWRVERSSPPPLPRKNGPNTLRIASHVMTLKTPSNLYAPPSSIDMEIMIRQHRESHPPPPYPRLLLLSLGKSIRQAIHHPSANFRPLSKGSITNAMLMTVFDTYLFPRSPSKRAP